MRLPGKFLLYLLASLFTFLLYLAAPLIPYNTVYEETSFSSVSRLYQLWKGMPTQSDEFLFVDVSRSKALVDLDDSSGTVAVTDRSQLTGFFTLLARDTSIRYKMVVCDLLFDLPTPADDSLEAVMNKIRPLLIPFGEDENGVLLPVMKSLPAAYAGYNKSSGWHASDKLLKYQLWPAINKPTIPLRMREMLTYTSFRRTGGFLWNGDGFYYGNFVPGFELTTSSDYLPDGASFFYMKELLSLLAARPAMAHSFFDNRIIVLGDFSNDVHQTYSGPVSGSHVLANVYSSFAAGENKITMGWLVYVFICAVVVTQVFMRYELHRDAWIEKLKKNSRPSLWRWLLRNVLKVASLFILLWVLSFFSYYFFRHHLNNSLVFLAASVLLLADGHINLFKQKIA